MTQMNIKILGANCSKCNRLEERLIKVIKDHNFNIKLEKITDVDEMSKYNIYIIPAVIINERVIFQGIVPGTNQLIQVISEFLQEGK